MSRFDLRDISGHLSKSRDTKAVVFELLRSMDAARSDWRASLAFYEVSADAFVDVFEIEGERLVRRAIVVPANQLPERLVRKLFDASAFSNAKEKRSLFSGGLGTVPCYVAEERDASELMPLTVIAEWRSCICLPLGDQTDLMGILVITSLKKNAFGGRAVSEILPVKSLVTAALVKHLRRAARTAPGEPPPPREAQVASETVTEAAIELRGQLEALTERSRELDDEDRSDSEELASLASEYEERQRASDEYREEFERVKATVAVLEAQAVTAIEHLSEAYAEVNSTSWEMADLERRVDFARRFLHLLGREPDERRIPLKVVGWLCNEFGIERCSIMTLDASHSVLQISAQCGLDAGVAAGVRVRVGQGVAGWVAHNRKPLLVRMRSQADITPDEQAETYNSQSFIAVPVVHNGRVYGVLNLSNKEGGELFNGVDFDCASLAGAALAMRLSSSELARGTAAWAG